MRNTRILALVALPLLALGCGEKEEEEHSGGHDSEVEEVPFAPEAGTYEVSSNEATADSCNFPEDTTNPDGGSDPFTISAVDTDAKTFVIGLDIDGETTDIACTWEDDQSFTCATVEVINIPLAELQIDATILGTSTVGGAFSDTATMTATQTIDVACEGAQVTECIDAAGTYMGVTLPCSMTVEIAAALSDEGPA